MKRLITRGLVLLTAAGALGLLGSGCAWQIGGDKKGPTVQQPTKGQELADLKKAKDQGAITDQEYQAQRQKVLDR